MLNRSHSFVFHLLVTLMVLAGTLVCTTPIKAASPSPTPSALSIPTTSSPSADTTEKLKARIEKIVEEKKNQIMGAISDLKQGRRGFIGEVQRVSSETITLKTAKGTQILALNQDVAVTKAGKAITVANIAIGDWAMVIGRTENDTFVPELIDLSSESLRPKTHLIALGTLTEVTRTTVTFMAKNQTSSQKLTLVKSTQFEDNEGNKLELKDIKKDAQVLLIGELNEPNWEVERIKLLAP